MCFYILEMLTWILTSHTQEALISFMWSPSSWMPRELFTEPVIPYNACLKVYLGRSAFILHNRQSTNSCFVQCVGNALLILSRTSPSKLAMGLYLQHSGSAAIAETASWTLQASYQTPGRPLQDKGHPLHQFGSAQMMASSDGSQVVLIIAASGKFTKCPLGMLTCLLK